MNALILFFCLALNAPGAQAGSTTGPAPVASPPAGSMTTIAPKDLPQFRPMIEGAGLDYAKFVERYNKADEKGRAQLWTEVYKAARGKVKLPN